MLLSGAEENDQPIWRRATYCQAGECLEAARYGAGGTVLIRDSKHPDGGNLSLSSAQWRALLSDIKSGQYNHLSR